MELRNNENLRTELGTDPRYSPKEVFAKFSLFFPSDYILDQDNIESIVQFQSFPNEGNQFRSAPLFLGVFNDNFVIDIRTEAGFADRIDLGVIEKDVWHDFIMHVKWSPDSDGLLEVWHQGNKVANSMGANCYEDLLNPYFKVGIYKFNNTTVNRVIFVDEVTLATTS